MSILIKTQEKYFFYQKSKLISIEIKTFHFKIAIEGIYVSKFIRICSQQILSKHCKNQN